MKGTLTNVAAIALVGAAVIGAAWYRGRQAGPPPDPVIVPTPSAVQAADARTGGLPPSTASNDTQIGAKALAKLPRLVDLGADKCKQCKALAPILDALREEYRGRLSVEFIDVWKSPKVAEPYNVRLIPTQILYDKHGRELWRHEGFISKKKLKELFAEKVGVK